MWLIGLSIVALVCCAVIVRGQGLARVRALAGFLVALLLIGIHLFHSLAGPGEIATSACGLLTYLDNSRAVLQADNKRIVAPLALYDTGRGIHPKWFQQNNVTTGDLILMNFNQKGIVIGIQAVNACPSR